MPSFLTRLFPGRRCYALGSLAKMNMYQAINDALKIAVVEDKDTGMQPMLYTKLFSERTSCLAECFGAQREFASWSVHQVSQV